MANNSKLLNILKNRVSKNKSKTTQVPTPAIPSVDDPTLQTWIKSMDSWLKQVGKNAVSTSDLVEYGVLDFKDGNLQANIPKVETPDLTVPKQIENLTANGAYSSITLTWETPKNKNFGHNAVYRAETDNFGKAVQIGSTIGDIYTDYIGYNTQAYYWVRTISKYSVEGDISLSATAKTSLDIGYMLGQLKDKITSSHLNSSLNQEIAKITDLKNSITTQYAGADDEYAGDVQISAGHVSEEILRIEGDKATAELVDSLDLKYREDGQEIRAIIQQETSARVNGQEAMAQTLDLLVVAVNQDIAAAIQEESNVRATQNSAMAEKITTIETDLGINSLVIEEALTSIDGIKGEWRVRMDQNGRVSGVSLGVNGEESQFTILADRFVLSTPSGTIAMPFTMDDDGKISIDTAFIKNGSIQNAQVGELNADKITAGDIAADRMKANIVEAVDGQFENLGAITAKIGHLRTADTGARLEFKGNLLTFYDDDGSDMILIGKWLEDPT